VADVEGTAWAGAARWAPPLWRAGLATEGSSWPGAGVLLRAPPLCSGKAERSPRLTRLQATAQSQVPHLPRAVFSLAAK
jgi:hypothetical protein